MISSVRDDDRTLHRGDVPYNTIAFGNSTGFPGDILKHKCCILTQHFTIGSTNHRTDSQTDNVDELMGKQVLGARIC